MRLLGRSQPSNTISAPAPPSLARALHEGQHLALLHQPAPHTPFEHGARGSASPALPAVHDPHAAQAALGCRGMNPSQALRELVTAQAVQVQLRLQCPVATAQARAPPPGSKSRAPEGQGLVGVEQGIDVEVVVDSASRTRRSSACAAGRAGCRLFTCMARGRDAGSTGLTDRACAAQWSAGRVAVSACCSAPLGGAAPVQLQAAIGPAGRPGTCRVTTAHVRRRTPPGAPTTKWSTTRTSSTASAAQVLGSISSSSAPRGLGHAAGMVVGQDDGRGANSSARLATSRG